MKNAVILDVFMCALGRRGVEVLLHLFLILAFHGCERGTLTLAPLLEDRIPNAYGIGSWMDSRIILGPLVKRNIFLSCLELKYDSVVVHRVAL